MPSTPTTSRLLPSLVWLLIIAAVAATMCSCSTQPTDSPTASSSTPPAPTLAPRPVTGQQLASDPAVSAAAQFEQRHCAWDWRTPLSTYLAGQQQLATPAYSRQLAATADPVSWRDEVVAGKQTVTCTISDARRLVGAPASPTSAYTRLTVTEQVTSTMGSFTGGAKLVSLRVDLVNGRWLVAGPYIGG